MTITRWADCSESAVAVGQVLRVETPVGYDYQSIMGRSNFILDCPFCGQRIIVYPWSFGVGKRCRECGAMLGPLFCYRKVAEEET